MPCISSAITTINILFSPLIHISLTQTEAKNVCHVITGHKWFHLCLNLNMRSCLCDRCDDQKLPLLC